MNSTTDLTEKNYNTKEKKRKSFFDWERNKVATKQDLSWDILHQNAAIEMASFGSTRRNYYSYMLFGTQLRFNYQLIPIASLLKKSENILLLEEDWDDENSPAISELAWKALVSFLHNYSCQVFAEQNKIIKTPKIYPSMNGSIDLDWEEKEFGLIINFDASGEFATYYADNQSKQKCEGVFNPHNFKLSLLPIATT